MITPQTTDVADSEIASETRLLYDYQKSQLITQFNGVSWHSPEISLISGLQYLLFAAQNERIRFLGLDYNTFLNEYTTDFEKNDLIVKEFINSIK